VLDTVGRVIWLITQQIWTVDLLVTNHGGAAGQRCLGAAVEVVNRHSAAERLLEMGVDIDTTLIQQITSSSNITVKR